MAKIEATELFRFDNFDTEISDRTVGHNRTVSHALLVVEDGRTMRRITGKLHGHPVFELTQRDGAGDINNTTVYQLRLDTCGHPTRTTRAAMADFLSAAGLRVGVSMAKETLSAWACFKTGGQHMFKGGGSIIVATLTQKDMRDMSDLYELEAA